MADLDSKHSIIGEVSEGFDTLELLNNAIVHDKTSRPLKNIRIKHTIIIEDPFDDPKGLKEPERSPSPERLRTEYR